MQAADNVGRGASVVSAGTTLSGIRRTYGFGALEENRHDRRARARGCCQAWQESAGSRQPRHAADRLCRRHDAGSGQRRPGGLRWLRRWPPYRGSAGPMGSAPSRKTAMTAELVLAAVAKPGKSLRDLRNRAMLLIGFAGAFRRSELIGLDVADVTETDDGLLLHIRRSKTDQEGHGRKVAIPT